MYSVKEAAELLNITPRAVQLKCKDEKLKKQGKSYLITKEHLIQWGYDGGSGNNTSNIKIAGGKQQEEIEEETVYEEFSIEQYNKLQEVIQEYPNLIREIQQYKEEIIYLRTELHSRTKQMDKLINTIDGSIKSLHQANSLQFIEKTHKGS